jgi:hypothetical protein
MNTGAPPAGGTHLLLPRFNGMDPSRAILKQKAAEMRAQAFRAETPFLGAMYRQMADEWELQSREGEDDPGPQKQKPS